MSLIQISCPSKTFLLGEYGVLNDGEALLLNTIPRFKALISFQPQEILFSQKSPSGQWLKKHKESFQKISLNWEKSYSGGFGFSSAQFNTLYAYRLFQKGIATDQVNIQKLWEDYRSLEFEGCMPSGADVVSQWVGGICIFKQKPFQVTALDSFFSDLGFLILKTGDSLATHEHLKNFKYPDVSSLKVCTQKGIQALKSKSKNLFLESVNDYRELLKSLGLVRDQTQKLLKEFSLISEIQAFKGCGAMGAETVIVFFEKKDKNLVKQKLSHLKIVSDETGLSKGIDICEVNP